MKAICVKPDRSLELRDIPTPTAPATGYLLIEIEAAAINHGDKTFLKNPAGMSLGARADDVWGASAAGRVVAVGAGVPSRYAGRRVAIYRSLQREQSILGLWCETVHVPYLTSLVLPDSLPAEAYSGSLVNVITAYAFLKEAMADGHQGVIVTAGNSATGHALAALARRRGLPAIFLARTLKTKAELQRRGIEHVLLTQGAYLEELADLAAKLKTTAVFDGVGGELITNVAPRLALNSTIYCYGFLGGATPISVQSSLFMFKNLTLKRFSNFESATVRDAKQLDLALQDLESCIDDPLFETRVGQKFKLDQFTAAMEFESAPGAKAVFIP